MPRDHRKLDAFTLADQLAVAVHIATAARETAYLVSLSRRLSMLEASEAKPLEVLADRVAGTRVNLLRSLRT